MLLNPYNQIMKNNMSEINMLNERQSENTISYAKKEGLKILREIRGSGELYLSLEYFYKRLYDFLDRENADLHNETVIATMCNFVPDELIYALGAYPLRICSGFNAFDHAGAEFLPSKGCPLVKATAGRIYQNNFPMGAKPKLIINPASCDQKKKLSEVMTDVAVPFYYLEIPSAKNKEANYNLWILNLLDLTKKLEDITRRKLTHAKLKKAISMVFAAQSEFRRLTELRKNNNLINGLDYLLISNVYFFDNITEWTKHLKQLNDEVEANHDAYPSDPKKPRIMLTGSPSIFPNVKVPYLIESLGGKVVADDFCSSQRLLYDMVAVDEWKLYDMIPALAARYYKPSTCPNLFPADDKKRNILNLIKENKVDGVLYQSLAGCQLFEMESLIISKLLEKEGVPMLYIETDYNPDDQGQLSTRIEAFIESIQSSKKIA